MIVLLYPVSQIVFVTFGVSYGPLSVLQLALTLSLAYNNMLRSWNLFCLQSMP